MFTKKDTDKLKSDINAEDQAEIDRLATRAQDIGRRRVLKTMGRAAFVVPALSTFLVSTNVFAKDAPDPAGSGENGK